MNLLEYLLHQFPIFKPSPFPTPGRLGKYMDLKMMLAKGGTNISHSTAKRFCAVFFFWGGVILFYFGSSWMDSPVSNGQPDNSTAAQVMISIVCNEMMCTSWLQRLVVCWTCATRSGLQWPSWLDDAFMLCPRFSSTFVWGKLSCFARIACMRHSRPY